jgi:hypothetical protein
MVKPKLLDRVREAVSEMDETYVSQFLTYLAVKRNVAASTQNQAPLSIGLATHSG